MENAELFFSLNNPTFVLALVAASIWSIIWKGFALWRAARLGSRAWFIVLLLVNTLGILEIIYLFIVTRKSSSLEQNSSDTYKIQ